MFASRLSLKEVWAISIEDFKVTSSDRLQSSGIYREAWPRIIS